MRSMRLLYVVMASSLFVTFARSQASTISESEITALRLHLARFYKSPAGAADAREVTVAVRLKLNLDGSLAFPPIVTTSGSTLLFRAARDSAVRAIYKAQPFNMLRPENYDAWKDIEITFDPELASAAQKQPTPTPRPDGLAASMPSDLRGEYTFGAADQCGYLRIDATGFATNEDLGCSVVSIKRTGGVSGERSSFQAEFICQIDDPKKISATGVLEFAKLKDTWVLAMHLLVKPQDRRRASLPSLQIFGKCGS